MEIGARNQLKGTVRSVETGAIMGVVVDVGDSAAGRRSRRHPSSGWHSKTGKEVTVIIEATEVMLATG